MCVCVFVCVCVCRPLGVCVGMCVCVTFRVARSGFFDAKKTKFGHFLKLAGLETFDNLLSCWPFFKFLEV